ncbi:P-loop containing nucleoside triphosphate hydrolase protein [Mycena crocata]|nr:P-loop containing nucleoside triphosphate hydrolase protein [Mycena crocata]
MFRRTKAQLVAYLRLPERSVHFIACKFDPVEERFYTLLKADAKSAYADDADFDDFALGLATAPTFEDTDFEDETRAPECKLCMSPAANEWPGHCINCAALKVQAQNLRKPTRASTKIRTIVKLLRKIATSNNQEKTVIFSQFTSMLDVIGPFVSAICLDFVRYDGKMSPKERKEALSETEKIPEQAFDRTHRVEQTRDVHIHKSKINGTVEDRIMELQDAKRELTKIALSGDHNMKLGMNELLALFK